MCCSIAWQHEPCWFAFCAGVVAGTGVAVCAIALIVASNNPTMMKFFISDLLNCSGTCQWPSTPRPVGRMANYAAATDDENQDRLNEINTDQECGGGRTYSV